MVSQVTAEPMPMQGDDSVCPNSVLGKVQLILGAFEAGAHQQRLTELSRCSGVPKASAYRLAQEMVQWGLLDRRGDAYQLGMRIFELGHRVPASAVLRSIARPILTDLFAATHAAIHLAVLDGSQVLYLDKISGAANAEARSRVGGRLPASCTATGKVLLGTGREGALQRDRLACTRLTRLTSRTVASIDDLDRQLAAVRTQGFGVELEEVMAGYGSVAVAVAGADGVVYASVSATESVRRLPVRRLLPALRSASAAIARAADRAMVSEPVAAGVLGAAHGVASTTRLRNRTS